MNESTFDVALIGNFSFDALAAVIADHFFASQTDPLHVQVESRAFVSHLCVMDIRQFFGRIANNSMLSDLHLIFSFTSQSDFTWIKVQLGSLPKHMVAGSNIELGRALTTTPPINARFLFHLFLSPQICDALVGDLDERYGKLYQEFGRRRANFWYWSQASRSIVPIVLEFTKTRSMQCVAILFSWVVAKRFLPEGEWSKFLDQWLKKLLDELLKRIGS